MEGKGIKKEIRDNILESLKMDDGIFMKGF